MKSVISKNGFLAISRVFKAIDKRLRSIISIYVWRRKLKKFGSGSKVQDRVFVEDLSCMSIGENCLISSRVSFGSENNDGYVCMGNNVQINRDVQIDYTGGIRIGDGVLISEGAIIYTHDHGLDPRSAPVSVPKIIENDVWIGAKVIVLPSCKFIGSGSIIGAGAVVASDIPSRTIYVGNPAKFVRSIEVK